jgi:hypothetical protein
LLAEDLRNLLAAVRAISKGRANDSPARSSGDTEETPPPATSRYSIQSSEFHLLWAGLSGAMGVNNGVTRRPFVKPQLPGSGSRLRGVERNLRRWQAETLLAKNFSVHLSGASLGKTRIFRIRDRIAGSLGEG